jgi:NPCBM/NEW2 domain
MCRHRNGARRYPPQEAGAPCVNAARFSLGTRRGDFSTPHRSMNYALLLSSTALVSTLAAAPKPVWQSHRVTRETVGHAVDVSVELNGAKKLWLVVTDGGDGYGMDWAEWVTPVVHGDFGEKKLTDVKPVKADVGWGQAHVNKNPGGQPMVVNGQPVSEGLAAHAPSVLEFDLPAGAKKFTAKGALDKGGVDQGSGATVQFQVFTKSRRSSAVVAVAAAADSIRRRRWRRWMWPMASRWNFLPVNPICSVLRPLI